MAKQSTSKSSLEVDEDRPWQERFWTAQRVAWVVMGLFVLAALLGVTGSGGPLASTSAQAAGASIDYPRITRWQADEPVTVRLPPSASGSVDVELSNGFVDRFTVESVHPEPSRVTASGSGHRYSFDVGSGGRDKSITFLVRSDHPFIERSVEARIGNAPPTAMTLTVLP
jgi:uncharacterized protein (DUF58 family)